MNTVSNKCSGAEVHICCRKVVEHIFEAAENGNIQVKCRYLKSIFNYSISSLCTGMARWVLPPVRLNKGMKQSQFVHGCMYACMRGNTCASPTYDGGSIIASLLESIGKNNLRPKLADMSAKSEDILENWVMPGWYACVSEALGSLFILNSIESHNAEASCIEKMCWMLLALLQLRDTKMFSQKNKNEKL